MKKILVRVAGAVLGVTACAEPTSAPVEGELATMRAKWEARGIEDYDLSVRSSGAWEAPNVVRVTVRGGVVQTCTTPEGVDVPLTYHGCKSIDDLYDHAAELLADTATAEGVLVFYDAHRSYVREFLFNVPEWADEEHQFQVQGFVVR